MSIQHRTANKFGNNLYSSPNSLKQIVENAKLDINAKSSTSSKLFLKVNESDTISFHSLGNKGLLGTSIISNGDGDLEWSNSVSAKQKDIYLNKTPMTIPFSTEWTKFSLPLHKDGSFYFTEDLQIIHIKMCFFYKYINSTSHLPFSIKVTKNGTQVYLNSFGDYDKYLELNKISDYLSLEASSSDVIHFYIKKNFNDVGDFQIQPLSYISYEIL